MTTTDNIINQNENENIFTKYINCEYCNNLTTCRLVRRLYQDPEYFKKHGEPYICNMCLSSMKKRGEIGTHPPIPTMIVFTRDLTSNRKF
jgi:hypothetical protein